MDSIYTVNLGSPGVLAEADTIESYFPLSSGLRWKESRSCQLKEG